MSILRGKSGSGGQLQNVASSSVVATGQVSWGISGGGGEVREPLAGRSRESSCEEDESSGVCREGAE